MMGFQEGIKELHRTALILSAKKSPLTASSSEKFSLLWCMFIGIMITGTAFTAGLGTIKGKVVNGEGTALFEAAIVFSSDSMESPVIMLADENGEYLKAGFPQGLYKISSSYMGYAAV